MSLTGLKFLGCTVKNFSTSIGLENQKSSVKISLVEDTRFGDKFIPNKQGTPLSIEFGAVKFTGLLQNYTKATSSDGRYVYETTLEDPRDILDGCTLILGDFEGATSAVPNLLNVYGYYESTGFNASLSNQAGMLWSMIKPAVETMTVTSSSFGGPLNYKGYQYSVDLSGLPTTSSSYRIGGNTISLLQIISEICHDAACDFFVEFEYGTRKIRVRTISRRLQPSPGVLSAYVQEQTLSGNCIRSSIGVEARNEVCSQFLIGGQKTDIYQSGEAYQYFGQDVNNVPILGYRTDENDIWTLTGDLNSLEISDITGATTYSANMLEMACAEFSQELWMAYVSSNKPALAALLGINGLIMDPALLGFAPGQIAQNNVAIFNFNGVQAANLNLGLIDQAFMWRISRLHSFVKKAYDNYLGKMFLVPTRFVDVNVEAETNNILKSHDFVNLGYSLTTPLGLSSTYNSFFGPNNGQFQAFCRYDPSNLFDTSAEFAEFNLDFSDGQVEVGKVRIFETVDVNAGDFFLGGIGEEQGYGYTYKLPASDNVSDDGFFNLSTYNKNEAAEQDVQVVIGINQWSNWGQFWGRLDADNRGRRYFFRRRFKVIKLNGDYYVQIQFLINQETGGEEIQFRDNIGFQLFTLGSITRLTGIFDLSRLSTESYVFDSSSYGVYVKCSVDENPYALPLSLSIAHGGSYDYGALVTIDNPVHIAPAVSTGADINQILNIFNIPNNAQNEAAFKAMMQRYAAGTCVQKVRNMAVQPIAFSIPVQDNLNCYGPWYAVGALGKVQYEKDTSLTPWDCGTWDNMDALGNAKVSQSLSFQQSQETGSFELVGAPIFNIGDAIVSGGPNITNMDIGYSDKGVTTTYRFHTFTNRFGVVNKSAIEAQRRTTRGILEANKKIQHLADITSKKILGANNAASQLTSTFLVNQFAPGFAGRSSNNIITFYCDDWDDGAGNTGKVISGGIVPMIEGPITWRASDNADFVKTASISLDGILRPFSTHLYDRDVETLADVDDMATYVKPNANYSSNTTVSFLNPFQEENDVQVLIQGNDSADLDGNNFLNGSPVDGDQRVIGLKGPLVISSFGWCTDDAPVPNASPADLSSSDFADNYLRNGQLWPTGPLEMLWDVERGVWTTMGHCIGTTVGSVANNSSTTINLYKDATNVINGRLKTRTVYNITGITIPAGTKVVCVWVPEAKAWFIANAAQGIVNALNIAGSVNLSANKIKFDESYGLQVVDDGTVGGTSGVPRIRAYPASISQLGVVDTAAQAFAGNKGFYCSYHVITNNGSYSTSSPDTTYYPGWIYEPANGTFRYGNSGLTKITQFMMTGASHADMSYTTGFGINGYSTGGYNGFYTSGVNPGKFVIFNRAIAGSYYDMCYSIVNSSGTVKDGQSITRNGMEFYGGILVGTSTEYTPANSSHWSGSPTTHADAIDRLAAAVYALRGSVAIP